MKKNLLLYSGLALSITLLPTFSTLAQTAIALSSSYVLLPNSEVAPTTIRFTPLLHATQDKSLFEVKTGAYNVRFKQEGIAVAQNDSSKLNEPLWTLLFDQINAQTMQLEGNKPTSTKVYYGDAQQNLFDEVWYKKMYGDISLRFFSDAEGNLKYNYILKPQADLKQVKFHFADTKSVKVDEKGNLQVSTKRSKRTVELPYIYQIIDFQETPVEASYIVEGEKIGIKAGEYKQFYPLIVEGTIIKATSDKDKLAETLSWQYRLKLWSKQQVATLKNPNSIYKTSSVRTLQLTEQDLLKNIVRTSPDYQKRLQAQAISMYYKGFWADRIAEALDVDKKLVMEWVIQWQRAGMDSLTK